MGDQNYIGCSGTTSFKSEDIMEIINKAKLQIKVENGLVLFRDYFEDKMKESEVDDLHSLCVQFNEDNPEYVASYCAATNTFFFTCKEVFEQYTLANNIQITPPTLKNYLSTEEFMSTVVDYVDLPRFSVTSQFKKDLTKEERDAKMLRDMVEIFIKGE